MPNKSTRKIQHPLRLTVFTALLTSFFGSTAMSNSDSVTEETDAVVWITESRSSNSVTLEVFARSNPHEAGRYQLNVRKTGTSGSSTSRQSGTIPAQGSTEIVGPLTTSRMSLRPGERLQAEVLALTPDGVEHIDKVDIQF